MSPFFSQSRRGPRVLCVRGAFGPPTGVMIPTGRRIILRFNIMKSTNTVDDTIIRIIVTIINNTNTNNTNNNNDNSNNLKF